MWEAVKPALVEMRPQAPLGWGINQIPYLFVLEEMSNEAAMAMRGHYIDAWGRVHTEAEAKSIANFDWMLGMLRDVSIGKVYQLARFDAQFELLWKPFMYHESQIKGIFHLGSGTQPSYFLEYGKKLQELRTKIIGGGTFFTHEDYKTWVPIWEKWDKDTKLPSPIEGPSLGGGGGYDWGYYLPSGTEHIVVVKMSNGEEIALKIHVDPMNDNPEYVRNEALALAAKYISQIPGWENVTATGTEVIQSTEIKLKNESPLGSGGGRAW